MKNPFKRNTELQRVTQSRINRQTFISFAGFLRFNALVYGAWKWLYHSPVEPHGITGGAHEPLRKALNQTEGIFKKTFSPGHLVKTYPKSMAAKKVRVNSTIGMHDAIDAADWSLTVNKKK